MDDETPDSLNISDVIEVIQTTDPEFASVGGSSMYLATNMDNQRNRSAAYVKILEQPASKALRFRYECEGRSAGSIPGVNSTPENKTFPSIQVVGYKGKAVVVVSCVTKDAPYRPHPHNLVGKEGCKKGICTLSINTDSMTATFSNLGIQCVKKKDIEEALRVREEIHVDPFRTGFAHRSQPTSIDLNAVRLCFQVFLESSHPGKFTVPLPPVVSDPIYDKKAMSDLVICKLSDCSCSVAGGKEIILLCEKVAKEDIQVRFYEEKDGHIEWEAYGDFQPTSVHKQVAISFRCPRYKTLDVDEPVKAYIQLKRPSDGVTSESLPFEFFPLDSAPSQKQKRKRFNYDGAATTLPQLHDPETARTILQAAKPLPIGVIPHPPDTQHMMQIKREPPEGAKLGSSYTYTVMPQPSPQGSPSPHAQGRTPSPMDYPYHPNAVVYRHNNYMGAGEMVQTFPVVQPNVADCNINMMGANRVFSANNLNSENPFNSPGLMTLGQSLPPNLRPPNRTIDTPVQGPHLVNLMPPNIPIGASGPSNLINVNDANCVQAENNILDLDQQYSLGQDHQFSLGQLDSAELANYGIFEGNLSENLSNNLTLSDDKPRRQQNQEMETQENMTDSFTRLTKTTLQEICNLNNMYKSDSDGN